MCDVISCASLTFSLLQSVPEDVQFYRANAENFDVLRSFRAMVVYSCISTSLPCRGLHAPQCRCVHMRHSD